MAKFQQLLPLRRLWEFLLLWISALPSSSLRSFLRLVRSASMSVSKEESRSVVHIPQEIIDNILIRLPLKSLVRFESVCKPWRSSILNPDFQRRDQQSLLSIVKTSRGQCYFLIREKENMALVDTFPVFWGCLERRIDPWVDRNEDPHSKFYISNCCNGMVLVCVGISFYLFNPSTRYSAKVLTLNYLDDEYGFDTWFCGGIYYKLHIGLYYDEISSDYMAVVLISHTLAHTVVLVEASLKGKQWNHLNWTFETTYGITVGPMVNGHIHWLNDEKIIRFEPDLKVFEELPSFQLPPNHTKDCRIVGIGILEGYLCVSRIFNDNLEIWVMKEYGLSESWTPIFSFSDERLPGIHTCIPLLLTKVGDLLFYNVDGIWVYNLGKKSFEYWHDRWFCWVVSGQNTDTPTGYNWNRMEHESFGNIQNFEKIREFWKDITVGRSEMGSQEVEEWD